jgi:dipeptidyl-peptidase-4
MTTILRALPVLLLAAVAPAADPVPGTPLDTSFLKEYAETRGYMLGRPQKPKISPDGNTVLFLRADPKTPKMKLFEFDVASGKTKELLSPEMLLKGGDENLSPEEKARRERQRVSVGGFADFHLDKLGKHILVMLAGKLYVFDRAAGKATQLKTGEGGAIVDPKWSPDGTKVAYVRGYDVYVYDLAAGKESPVTTGGTMTKTHGLAEFVAQEEMGRHSGYWWSPDGKHIAYEEADHAGVETWYVADPLKPDAKPAEQFYPRPGKKNVAVKLGIIPVEGGKTTWVEWDHEKWEYLVDVIWQKYGPLTIEVENRIQHQLQYRRVNTETGKTDLITANVNHELGKTQAFLTIIPNSLNYLKDGERFLLVQENWHFKLGDWGASFSVLFEELSRPIELPDGREAEGREFRYACPVDYFRELLACDPESSETIIATSAGSRLLNPVDWLPNLDSTQTVLRRWNAIAEYKAPPGAETDGPAVLPFCKEPGVYTGAFSRDLTLSAVTKTTLQQLPQVTVYKDDTKQLGTLPSVALEPPFKPNVTVEKVGDYWTAVVRPRDFDPKKKYPVIVDVYGGPKHLHVVQAMRNWLVPQWLADQGFVVVAIDNRGTPGRGRDWERAVYQKFGTVPLEDQVKGLAALCDKFPELDRERVGIVGWSFGGYMAANGVLRRPDVFKAAVAGAPVTDWEDYDTHYTERYMGLLPESKKAYDEASLIPLAKDLKRPLLLVHGTADDNVYYRHTLKLADALFRAGKDFEALALPGVTHMYSADPVVMERLWARTAGFFKAHLGQPR